MFFSNKRASNNSVLGVDINREQIRIVEFEKINEDPDYDFKILNYVVHNLPKGSMHSNDTVEPQILGEEIRDIVERESFKKKKVISAVSNERLVVTELKVPLDASEDEIENLIKNSSKTHAINGIETMAFDFYEDESKETEEDKIIVLKMYPIDSIQSREDAFLIGELTPHVIETDNLALNRMFKTFAQQFFMETQTELNEDDTFLFAEVRRQNLITHTFQKGVVQTSMTEILKRDMRTEDEVRAQVVDLIKKRSFVIKSNNNNFKGIFLAGETDNLFKISELFQEDDFFDDLEILVSNPLLRVKYSGVNSEAIILSAPSLVLACGLAMREIK